MKCPWRPVQVTTTYQASQGQVVKTDFAECYNGECPFYSPEHRISANLSTPEYCKRIKQEVSK